MSTFDNSTPHLSSVYDAQILNTIPNYDSFHQETIDIIHAAGIRPKLWLDTGAGTGTLIRLCMDVFPETRFLLADPSAEMLAEAKTKLSGLDPTRISYLEPTDTQNLVLPTGEKPDVVTAIQAHHYLSAEERRIATAVCYDALKDGGIFITFENTRPFTREGIELAKTKWGNYQMERGKTPAQAANHLNRFDTEYFPITPEEHLTLYRACGFRTVELLWFSYMQAGFYCIK